MSDFRDPLYRDPRDPLNDPLVRRNLDPDLAGGAGAPWGWIIGAFLLAAVMVYVFTATPSDVQTATNTTSPITRSTQPPSPPTAQPAPSGPATAPSR